MLEAPASIAFSTSSLTAEAGRSTTGSSTTAAAWGRATWRWRWSATPPRSCRTATSSGSPASTTIE
jgi:hypothetical protein